MMKSLRKRTKGFSIEWLSEFNWLFYPLLILGGILKLSIYYRTFHVNIFNYINFSDILTSFLKDIIVIIVALLFALYFISSRKTNLKNFELFKRFKFPEDLIHIFLFSFFTFVASYVIVSDPYTFKKYTLFDSFELNVWNFFTVSVLFVPIYNKFGKNPQSRIFIKGVYLFLMYILIIYNIAYTEGRVKLFYGADYVNEFKYEGEWIKSDTLNFYIGKVGDYYLFYNWIGSDTKLIRVDKVSEMKTREVKGLLEHIFLRDEPGSPPPDFYRKRNKFF